jgi:hypothetical protein
MATFVLARARETVGLAAAKVRFRIAHVFALQLLTAFPATRTTGRTQILAALPPLIVVLGHAVRDVGQAGQRGAAPGKTKPAAGPGVETRAVYGYSLR